MTQIKHEKKPVIAAKATQNGPSEAISAFEVDYGDEECKDD